MRALLTSVLVIVQTICFTLGNSQFPEEDNDCLLDFARTGSCVHIGKCPEAIEQIHKGERPKICGFEGIYPIVCCEINFFQASRQRDSIATKKCNEFAVTSIPTTTTTTTNPTLLVDTVIIGGEDAYHLEFPHMAILGYGNYPDVKWSCGGSLISERFVLTAAHCINTRLGSVQHVKLGVHQLNHTSEHEQIFEVNNVFRHPDYVGTQDYHDVGLVELDRPADIQSGVRPACLNTWYELPDDSLVATGWGAVELYGNIYNILQKVDLRQVAIGICGKYYDGQSKLSNGVIDDWQMCADGGGKLGDTCQGDSGGPLQIKLNGDSLYTIVGITSLGIKCGVVPGVYTRVSHYVPWIESIVWPEN